MAARVLIVDDIPFNIKLLQTKLEQQYYEVITANNAEDAIQMMKEDQPDIVLMDAMMPDLSGVEAIQIIKKDADIAHIPIIVVTALNSQEDRVRSLKAGADDFVTKPINDKALTLRMKSLIRIKQMTDEWKLRSSSMKEIEGEDGENVYSPINIKIDEAKVLMLDDDVIQMKKIGKFLEDQGINFVPAPTTKEAINHLQNEQFDLMIVSTVLDNEDGLRFCSKLRAEEELASMPVMILVDQADSITLNKGLEIGLTDYIVTPIEVNEFFVRVQSQIKRKRFQESIQSTISESVSASVIDPLTQLYNRRYFDQHSKKLLDRANKEKKNLGLLMIDLDHFKNVNDTYGHPSGDAVLTELSTRIKASTRRYDLCARFGGEEFVILLFDAKLPEAKKIAERIREAVEKDTFAIPEKPGKINCTCSIGLSMYEDGKTITSMLDEADKCLYVAKEGGRNQVVVSNAKTAKAAEAATKKTKTPKKVVKKKPATAKKPTAKKPTAKKPTAKKPTAKKKSKK